MESGRGVQNAVGFLSFGKRLLSVLRRSAENRSEMNSEITTAGIFPVALEGGDLSQLDVGRQCNNRFRITVHESCLAPNIGLEEFWSLHTLELVRPIPAECGYVNLVS